MLPWGSRFTSHPLNIRFPYVSYEDATHYVFRVVGKKNTNNLKFVEFQLWKCAISLDYCHEILDYLVASESRVSKGGNVNYYCCGANEAFIYVVKKHSLDSMKTSTVFFSVDKEEAFNFCNKEKESKGTHELLFVEKKDIPWIDDDKENPEQYAYNTHERTGDYIYKKSVWREDLKIARSLGWDTGNALFNEP